MTRGRRVQPLSDRRISARSAMAAWWRPTTPSWPSRIAALRQYGWRTHYISRCGRREQPARRDAGGDPAREAARISMRTMRDGGRSPLPTTRRLRVARCARRARRPGASMCSTNMCCACRTGPRCRRGCATRGIGTGIHYPVPGASAAGVSRPRRARAGRLPARARRRRAEVLSLPMYPELTDAQVSRCARPSKGCRATDLIVADELFSLPHRRMRMQSVGMPDMASELRPCDLAGKLIRSTAAAAARAAEDPFGNPVLSVSLAIARQWDTGELTEAAVEALIRHLRDAAFADRARRIADYVGGTDAAAHDGGAAELAQRLLRPDPDDSPVRWAEYRAPGRTHALRRGVHRASDIRAAARGRAGAGGDRQRAADRVRGFASHRPPSHAGRTSSRRPRPPSPMAATRSTGSTRRCCRSRAAPGRTAGPSSSRVR